VYVCVGERERKRERERVSVRLCVYERAQVCATDRGYVCEFVHAKISVCVCLCLCVSI